MKKRFKQKSNSWKPEKELENKDTFIENLWRKKNSWQRITSSWKHEKEVEVQLRRYCLKTLKRMILFFETIETSWKHGKSNYKHEEVLETNKKNEKKLRKTGKY